MFTVHGYFGKFWTFVIVGTKTLHNFARTTTPVCHKDWKEIPNTIEGAEDGKIIERFMA